MFLSLLLKEAFDLPCLPLEYKDEIEISEFVKFCNKSFTEFFVSSAKRELDENFLSKRKFRMMLSFSKSLEMLLALFSGPMMQFLFPLGRDLRFPMCWQFRRFLEDAAIELVGITQGSIEEMVVVFLNSENNVRVVAIKTFK